HKSTRCWPRHSDVFSHRFYSVGSPQCSCSTFCSEPLCISRLALTAVRIDCRSKALRAGRSLSGGVGSNPTSDKSFPLVCGETLDSLSPPRCRPRPPFCPPLSSLLSLILSPTRGALSPSHPRVNHSECR